MDKQEYREFLEEIKKSYKAGHFEQVAAYADELDFGKIKDPRILEMISDSYDHLGETDNAIDALAASFARNKTSKQTAYKLGELCIKAGDLDEAVTYYETYRKLAGNNSKALLLKYEIGKAGGVPAKELVRVLEAYNAREKDEKWEYELARLYHETGQAQKCVETCDNIFLWYSGGEYVKKALELKFSHTPLSKEQQIRYEEMMKEFLDPDEMTKADAPEVDEVALKLADEYLSGADDYEKQMAKAEEAGNRPDPGTDDQMTETARLDAIQDTRVIPIAKLMGEITSEAEEVPGEPAEEDAAIEAVTEAAEEEPVEEAAPVEEEPVTEEPAPVELTLEEKLQSAGTITFEELRAMIHDGNRKQAQSGMFFTYNEPTPEDIAEEKALKEARAEARRKAEEEAERKAAEEAAAREAAAAAAREAARLEEEARVEAALRKEEEARMIASAAVSEDSQEEAVPATTQRIDPEMEIDETRFINRNEVLARLDEADKKIAEEEKGGQETESLGFTGLIDVIASEVNIDEVTAAPPAEDAREDDEVGATQIFTREELDTVLGKPEPEVEIRTPEQKLGAAIEQIIDDAHATVERDMEETKSIRIVLPVAAANKLGVTSAKLSQYASSVIKPELEMDMESSDSTPMGTPRIIDNVDFSYIPVSSDEDGQLGLNIEFLTLNNEFEVEGQLTIDDVLKNYSRKLKLNQAKVLDIESERLRKIQEAVNLTAPVKLPYSMDDLLFDDIEMSDINGNAEVVEGDIFQFDPESIGVIPSDEELLAAIEKEEEAKAEPAAEEVSAEIPAEEEIHVAEELTIEEEVPVEEAAEEETAPEEEAVPEEEIPADEAVEAPVEEETVPEEEIPADEAVEAPEEEEIVPEEEAVVEEEIAEAEAEEEIPAEEPAEIPAEEVSEEEIPEEKTDKSAGEEYLPKEADILAAIAAIAAQDAAAEAADEIPSDDDILAALEAEVEEEIAEAEEPLEAEIEPEAEAIEEETERAAESEEEISEADRAIAAFEMKAAEEAKEEIPAEVSGAADELPSDDDILAALEAEVEEETAEAEEPIEVEIEPEAEAIEEETERAAESEEEISEADRAIAAFEMKAAEEAKEEIPAEVSGAADELPSDDDILAALEAEEEEAVEPEAEAMEEETETAEDISEADKAIAEFDMRAAEVLGEAEKAIDDELFDVMAELGQKEEAPADNAETEEVLESDTFEEMFGELMSDEVPSKEAAGETVTELEPQMPETTASSFTEAPEEVEIPAEPEIPEEEPVAVSSTGYMLPDDSRERMSEFLLIDGMEQQIVDVVSDLIEKKKAGQENAGNLIVTGDIKSGKTFLAIEMIKAVTEEFGLNNGKVAKVQAELLNGKNIEKVFEKIGGSDLIIENVGYLDDETIENLTSVISSGRFSSMVIIEGNSLAVESIFNSFPKFGALFENRIDINELSIVQWAEIAMKYADEKGFVLDDMAKLALHAKINEINVPTERLGYDEILDIMDDAIARAEKRNSGRLFAAFKKGEDEKSEIIESDFM